MNRKTALDEIGIKDTSFELLTIAEMVKRGLIERPLDGNHGEMHPKESDFVESGVPFIMASDIKNGVVDYTNCKFITRKHADSLRKGFAKNGDVLLTHKATIGRTAIVGYDKQPYVMLTPQVAYYRVRDSQRLDRGYLRYYFESSFFQGILSLWAGAGSTRAYLGITDQGKLPFVLPPIGKQKKIAAILTAYDELIENNRHRVALLEKIVDEIYREWFVRKRFPGHKQAKFVKGIPANWDVIEIGAQFTIFLGGTPSRDVPSYWNGDVPWINSGEINKLRIVEATEFISAQGLRYSAAKIMPKRTTVLAITGATLGQVSLTEIEVCANQSVVGIYDTKGIYNEYIFRFVTTNIENMIAKQSGGGQQHINKDVVEREKIVLPPELLVKDFQKAVCPIYDKIRILLLSSKSLSKAREELLTRLISGKLNVANFDIQFPPSMTESSPSKSSPELRGGKAVVHA